MKKYILFAALLLAVLPAAALAAARPARAEEAFYARVLEEGVYLYSSADETSGLFILPRSYFVRIESEEDEWYRVLYREGDPDIPPVRGYCKRSEITPVDFIPQTPYLFYQIDITYRAGSGDYPDGFLDEFTLTADYFGKFYYGSEVSYYICLDGQFGYVPSSACPEPDYPENIEHTESGSGNTSPAKKSNAVNIVLVCALAVAALGAVYFLFRPAKSQKERKADYFDDAEDLF